MIENIWKQFLDIAQEEVGSRVVETWFKAISLQKWDTAAQIVYLKAPNTFVRNWVNNHYLSLFQIHLGRLLTMQMPKVVFVDDANKQEQAKKVDGSKERCSTVIGASVLPSTDRVSLTHERLKAGTRSQQLIDTNTYYDFRNFVVGPSNSLAYAAAHAIVQKPGVLYNPLYICGAPGLGKTHLLQAIGNSMREQNKSAVLYCTAAQFVDEFVSAIKTDSVHKFQKRFSLIDALLVDDVQFLSNKEQSQEIFFHIFNSLYESRKQVVFTSDLDPHQIVGVGDRLRSRLSAGLVAGLTVPTSATCVGILQQKISQEKKTISDEVVQFIASCSFSNVRELEGAFIKLLAFSSLTNQQVTVELAKTVLMPFAVDTKTRLTADQIAKTVGSYYRCTFEQICSKNRAKEIVLARQVTMFFLKKLLKKSLREIGTLIGNRNHATILHGLGRMEELLHDLEFSSQIHRIEEQLLARY